MTARAFGLILFVVFASAVAAVLVARCEGTPPRIEGPSALVVGRKPKQVEITVSDQGSGLRDVEIALANAQGQTPLLKRHFAGSPLPWFGRPHPREERLAVAIDAEALHLREGTARLQVIVHDAAWRRGLHGNEATLEIPVTVDLTPPRIGLETGLTYVRRGGAGLVVYTLSEPTVRDGVEVGDVFFRGDRLPGDAPGAERYAALFAIPVDAPPNPPVRVVASDAAGNQAEEDVDAHILDATFPKVSIHLTKEFLDNKVVELAKRVGVDASDPLAAFQKINSEIRKQDEARIHEIALKSSGPPLFHGAFVQWPDSKVMSQFAEHRTYLYQGRQVSTARHYGFDLASIANSPVTAENAGRVLYADRLGIYGNCVMIDHGLGLVSLYGHLSRIDVHPGESVKKGGVIGISGQTGMAEGDHLHFAILVNGVYANPLEWWDPKWVREHVENRLAEAEGKK